MKHSVLAFLAAASLCLATISPAQGTGANGLRKGDWRPQDVPSGYTVQNIGKYQLQSDCDPAVAERVGKQLNAMFRIYSRDFPASKTPKGGMVVKLFSSRKEFLAYGAPPSAAGYFSPTDKEMVGYDTGKLGGSNTKGGTTGNSSIAARWRDRFTLDTLGVFNHEGWHQYFHWSCGSQIPFPSWADEGIGEYYNPAYLDNGEMVLGAPNDYRLPTIQAALWRNKHVPLAELITYEQRDYYARAGLCYAEGWALVHFFFEHPRYAKEKYVQKFVKVFRDEHSIEKTNKQVFRRIDWAAVEVDFKEWILAMPPVPDPEDIFDADESPSEARSKQIYEKLSPEVKKALDGVIAKRQGVATHGLGDAESKKPVAEPTGEAPDAGGTR